MRNESSSNSSLLPFSKNENGHYVITIVGRGLTGEQELYHLKESGFQVTDGARQILTSNDYNKNHRLEDGGEYNAVLFSGREVKGRSTTVEIQQYANILGYELPRAGMVPHIRQILSGKQLEEKLDIVIVALHENIRDVYGEPSVLGLVRGQLDVFWVSPFCWWGNDEVFLFTCPFPR